MSRICHSPILYWAKIVKVKDIFLRHLFKKTTWIYYLVFIFAIYTFFYNGTLPLNVDESYYWLWSLNPQLGYYDHPPMIAFMIKIFTAIFGDSEAGVRSVTVFCMSVSLFFVYKLSLELTRCETTAFLTAFILSLLPFAQMGSVITTPDSPLSLFWSMSLYFSYKVIFYKEKKYFIYAGISIGCMMLSKYTSILFIATLFVYIIFFDRKIFFNRYFWISILIAFIVVSPMVYWNYMNDWISFNFQYSHGTSSNFMLNYKKFFEFIGGNFLVFTPILMIVIIIAQIKNKLYIAEKKYFFINLFFLLPLFFFLYKGLFKKMELNWVAPVYISATIICIDYIVKLKLRKTFVFSILFSILVMFVLRYPNVLHLPKQANIQNRLFGYKEVVHYIDTIRKKDNIIYADHLTRASILTYYLKGHPLSYIPTKSRFSQFDLWGRDKAILNRNGIYLSKDNKIEELKKIFQKVELIKKLKIQNKNFKTKQFYIYKVYN